MAGHCEHAQRRAVSDEGEDVRIARPTDEVQTGPWLLPAARDAGAARPVVAALAGVLEPLDVPVAPPGDAPGAIVCDCVDDALLDLARRHSRGGERRVLAIATDAAALEGTAAWQLLRAGIADVLAWDGQVAS